MKQKRIRVGQILVLKSRRKLAKLGVNTIWTLLANQFVKIVSIYPTIVKDKQTYLVYVGDLPIAWQLNCFKGY